MKRKALGRGLDALIPKPPLEEALGAREVDINLLSPNPHQPRLGYSEKRMEELMESIRANDIIEPLVVRPKEGGYQIIVGERRWRAAKKLGLTRVPVVIKDVQEEKLLEWALIENLQREDLNPLEEARAYAMLLEKFQLTQEEVSRRVGKDRSSVANYLRLLKLPKSIQQEILAENVTMGHARALLSLDDRETQLRVCQRIKKGRLSVREAERLVKRLKEGREAKVQVLPPDPFIRAAEERLQRKLGTKVSIRRKGRGGRIEIAYYSEEDLQRLFSLLLSSGD
ncbi:MAG: ParB/RepB/Spo0J family partition protein [Acidobacteriota bacterium]